jgi:hypothetical protein
MARDLTADEVRAESVNAMPSQLGELHYELHNEVAWLHLKWRDFRALYTTSPATITLLNESAPAFFGNLQRMYWEDVLLHLCRLTDPIKSAGKETLTILRIPTLIPDPDLKRQVNALATEATTRTDFARPWRNRRLAHRELPPLSGHAALPLPSASVRDVEEALVAIRATLRCIELHYLKANVAYEHSIEAPGGVALLLIRLRDAIEVERKEREGALRPMGLAPPR